MAGMCFQHCMGDREERQATCTLNLVRIFVLRVFKKPQAHNCLKIFVHACIIFRNSWSSAVGYIDHATGVTEVSDSIPNWNFKIFSVFPSTVA